jgi:nucleotide-binding universal stress UspA family protein
MKIQKILAPTDLSELSVEGLRYGLKAAQSEGAELLVYHVIGPSEEWLARHEEMFTMKQVVENRRRVLTQFVKKAEAEKADLIIMSTHGWSGLLHFLIGSVTEKVVNRAACPVLSIHPLESASLPPASAS